MTMSSSIKSVRVLSFIFIAGLALASIACGAAPDGEPSHDPTSSSVGGDHSDDPGNPAAPSASASSSASGATSASPGSDDPSGGGGPIPHGPPVGGGGGGSSPHGQRIQ